MSSRPLELDELFREAMTRLASGVAVITARRPDGLPCGIAATALTSYSASFQERARGIASYVDRILKGAKPADLPVQQPSTFEPGGVGSPQ